VTSFKTIYFDILPAQSITSLRVFQHTKLLICILFNRNKTPQKKPIKEGLLGVIFHSELAEKAIRTESTNLTENITFPDLLRIKLNQLNAIYNGNYQISRRNIFHISQLLSVFAATVEINALTPTSVITNYN